MKFIIKKLESVLISQTYYFARVVAYSFVLRLIKAARNPGSKLLRTPAMTLISVPLMLVAIATGSLSCSA